MKSNLRFVRHPLFVAGLLYFLPPAGLLLMWVEGIFTKQVRLGITAIIAILFLFGADKPDNYSFSREIMNFINEPAQGESAPVKKTPEAAAQAAPVKPAEESSPPAASIQSDSVPDSASQADTAGFVQAQVERVVDGDTVVLTDGTKVRLIGVNTPESTKETQPYGEEASNHTKEVLAGRTVWLEKDVSETDQYGRALRIVWLELPRDTSDAEIRAKMYNAQLVLDGYAEPYTFPPDVKYAEKFKDYAREAREKETGLWAIDPVNGTTRGDLDE